MSRPSKRDRAAPSPVRARAPRRRSSTCRSRISPTSASVLPAVEVERDAVDRLTTPPGVPTPGAARNGTLRSRDLQKRRARSCQRLDPVECQQAARWPVRRRAASGGRRAAQASSASGQRVRKRQPRARHRRRHDALDRAQHRLALARRASASSPAAAGYRDGAARRR